MIWKFITRIGFVEVWETHTRYLACYHYGRIFYFVDTKEEAIEVAKELYKSLKEC